MTMIPVPPDEQPGLAEEWAVQQRPEPPTRDLRRKKRTGPAGVTLPQRP
jgi:hypothetical protein